MRLLLTPEAEKNLSDLEADKGLTKRLKAVRKTLALMETNLRHPSPNTHEFTSLVGTHSEKVFEAYAENRTPADFRVFWHYGPGKDVVTVVAITAHP